jgi:hypothetical protein
VTITYGPVLLEEVRARVNGACNRVGGCGIVQAEDEASTSVKSSGHESPQILLLLLLEQQTCFNRPHCGHIVYTVPSNGDF